LDETRARKRIIASGSSQKPQLACNFQRRATDHTKANVFREIIGQQRSSDGRHDYIVLVLAKFDRPIVHEVHRSRDV
jgi:hypothetical protein